nr:alpha carbonic anhydrase 4-like [Coffea arabica]
MHGAEKKGEVPFTYQEGTGKGPKNWGHIDPQWQVCDNGKLQSPIDLLDERAQASPNLKELKRAYKPAPAVLKNRGHDIMVEWTGDAGKIIVNGTDYKVLQCHWHSPSEHNLNGKRYNLELHLVHKNSLGDTAVVGILYELGRPDPFLAQLLHHIKTTEIGGAVDLGIVSPLDIKFGSRKYYRYVGSLTIPPCTEGVVWTIIKKVRTVSREQIKAITDAMQDGFEANARPIQQQNGRQVYFYRPKA